jgi:hypothetical protein
MIWEIFSYGDTPYPTVMNAVMLYRLKSGMRLSKPLDCPAELYDVLKRCWAIATTHRPSFRIVEGQIAAIETRHLISNPTVRDVGATLNGGLTAAIHRMSVSAMDK